MSRRRWAALAALGAVGIVACSGSDADDIVLDSRPPTGSALDTNASETSDAVGTATDTADTASITPAEDRVAADVTVSIDAATTGAEISPQILGLSGVLTPAQLDELGTTVISWGGNPATRYNYQLGNAWNSAADFEFRNTNYDNPPGKIAQEQVLANQAVGVESRLAIPTLGWIAKNDDTNTCSFPRGNACLPASAAGDCKNPKAVPDPSITSVRSTPDMVGAWLREMSAAGANPEFVAMDNEPDLWGNTHFDVHPACPTYEEILDRYLTYSAVVRDAMPDAALLGPALCCWYDYWRIAPGPADGSEAEFLSWFLDQVKAHDDDAGTRSIDYLDVHFYPQTDVFNDENDPETNARRLRSTRGLWDPGYRDESWINDRIQFIPRMQRTIAEHYPDTKLFISEWNFGNDANINGALAIADVLGIYGREGVDAAAYWRNPPVDSPGWFAFAMHGNYDGNGSRFGGASLAAASTDAERVAVFAALDGDADVLRVMLINRDPDAALSVALDIAGFEPAAQAKQFQYGPADLAGIASGTVTSTGAIALPASSITVLELEPR